MAHKLSIVKFFIAAFYCKLHMGLNLILVFKLTKSVIFIIIFFSWKYSVKKYVNVYLLLSERNVSILACKILPTNRIKLPIEANSWLRAQQLWERIYRSNNKRIFINVAASFWKGHLKCLFFLNLHPYVFSKLCATTIMSNCTLLRYLIQSQSISIFDFFFMHTTVDWTFT